MSELKLGPPRKRKWASLMGGRIECSDQCMSCIVGAHCSLTGQRFCGWRKSAKSERSLAGVSANGADFGLGRQMGKVAKPKPALVLWMGRVLKAAAVTAAVPTAAAATTVQQ